VRFDSPSTDEVAETLRAAGSAGDRALACARLALGDAGYASELASDLGAALRGAAEVFARAPLAGADAPARPWSELMGALKGAGEAVARELAAAADADLELYPTKERRRIKTEWEERSRRSRRRTETAALDRGLGLVSLWYADLVYLALGAEDLVRNVDRLSQLGLDGGASVAKLREAIELVEETRLRFVLNVSEELALEALSLRLGRLLAR
jgi:DNA polymerase-3 subunit delta'